jgi:prephenate dehydratase
LEEEKDWAAIGTSQAADYYNLEVLEEEIQDNKQNWTRFVLLAQEDTTSTGQDKTSIVCAPVEDHPGVLYEILREFANREINLTKIESRPAKKLLGDYIFFIDFEGHREEGRIKEALREVKEKTSWCQLLGSYPEAQTVNKI